MGVRVARRRLVRSLKSGGVKMSKVTFEFDLEEDCALIGLLSRIRHAYSDLHDIDEQIRGRLKYGENVTDEDEKLYESIRERLWKYVGDF